MRPFPIANRVVYLLLEGVELRRVQQIPSITRIDKILKNKNVARAHK